MKLELIAYNPKKIYEVKYIEKYIYLNKINICIVNYSLKKNINLQILKAYEKKPDIIIINFTDKNCIDIKTNKIPRYPIFINDIFYISPICIEQLNGFSNLYHEKKLLIDNFIIRIKLILGGIISYSNFNFNNYIDNKFDIKTGIKDNYNNIIIAKYNFVNCIPSWMTKNIEKNVSGWLEYTNKLCIDYIFDNYNIKNIAELGCYYGKSTKYIANKKKKNSYLFAFDNFENILLTRYCIKKIEPIDLKYFLKYIKFESFTSILSKFNNIYSIKYDCSNAAKFLHNNKIDIDFFYIDFEKNDDKLIIYIDEILRLFPNAIVLGDDAVHLNKALKYFESKYYFEFFESCYFCTNKQLSNMNNLKILVKNHKIKSTNDNINDIKEYENYYKSIYIAKLIKKQENINQIIKILKYFNIDPNETSEAVNQNGNLLHLVSLKYFIDRNYCLELYNKLKEIYEDKNISNSFNLKPTDYFKAPINFF